MYRTALIALAAILVSACGTGGSSADIVASVQVDDSYDVVVIRSDEADLTPSLLICRVPHGEADSAGGDSCADVDPWRWSRTSIAAALDPGPESSLMVVVHDEATFSVAQPASLNTAAPIELYLPAGPIGALAPLTLHVIVAESELTMDNAVGCLSTGLAGGINPVFITASAVGPGHGPGPLPPADLQSACT